MCSFMARLWSDEELTVGLDRSLSATEVADRLGRSVRAVQAIRAKYPRERTAPAACASDVCSGPFMHAAVGRAGFEDVTNWQGTADSVTQRMLSTLLYTALSLAVDNLRCGQGVEPFAITATGEFQHALLSGSGEYRGQRRAAIIRQLSAQADRVTAFAMVCDTNIDALCRDSIEICLQHRDGLAITVRAPYIKRGKIIAVGELTAESAAATIW